ncbi:MAG: multicopper oxidase domain-containing protein [Nitrospirota bacterium]|nr:multicopper oxidase domain-containing protein [Nitrospirota bacterium]
MRPFGLLYLAMVLALAGCQTTWSFDRPTGPIDHVQFMHLWKTYTHCQSSSDPADIRLDAQHLDQAAHAVKVKSRSSLVLPAAMQHLISDLPSRLAVDPQAMALACALHGGQVARSVGRPRLAVELFNVVLTKQADAAYGSYVFEASRGLEHLWSDTPFVLETSAGAPDFIVEQAMEGQADRVTLVDWPPQRIMPQRELYAHSRQARRFSRNVSMLHQNGAGKEEASPMSQTDVESISNHDARCPADAPVRQYDISAINVEISLSWWLNFSYPGYMYVLTENIAKIREEEAKNRDARRKEGQDPGAVMNEPPGQWIQRLILRGSQGDCMKISLRNQLEGGEDVSLHIDGANVVVDATGQPASTTNSNAIAAPGKSIELEWYIHPSTQEGDRQFHSYSHDRELTAAGLFGTFVVEPRGSASLDPRGSGEPTPLKSGMNLSRTDSQREGKQ